MVIELLINSLCKLSKIFDRDFTTGWNKENGKLEKFETVERCGLEGSQSHGRAVGYRAMQPDKLSRNGDLGSYPRPHDGDVKR
jgi:hypothetical protein